MAHDFLQNFCGYKPKYSVGKLEVDQQSRNDIYQMFDIAKKQLTLDVYYFKNFGLRPLHISSTPCVNRVLTAPLETCVRMCNSEEVMVDDILEGIGVSHPQARQLVTQYSWLSQTLSKPRTRIVSVTRKRSRSKSSSNSTSSRTTSSNSGKQSEKRKRSRSRSS
jgi:hypothetical protein